MEHRAVGNLLARCERQAPFGFLEDIAAMARKAAAPIVPSFFISGIGQGRGG